MSSTVGSSISTFWKRRSRAASFSRYLRYSSSVVATDAMQFTARKCRFKHIAGIHGALGLARANHGVQFVDEQDDLAFLLGEVAQYRFQTFLEFATELGTSDKRAHVERQNAFAAQTFRHLIVDDALGKTLR